MARTYLEVNPQEEVVLLDSSHTVGGVWAKERLYKGLRTNNITGFFEYSDYPMDPEKYSLKPNEHIPGETVHQYLFDFAERFDLLHRIQLGSVVHTVKQRSDDTWVLDVSRQGQSKHLPLTVWTKRLVIATGMTSDPNMPKFKGANSFARPIFHSSSLPKYQDVFLPTEKRAVVLGGSKGAWDVVYAYASMGMEVDWIIRPDGSGPVWMANTKIGSFHVPAGYLLFIRMCTWFSPSIWNNADRYGKVRSWIHGTWLGCWIVHILFMLIGHIIILDSGYDRHPETKKLKPWLNIFWIGTMRGILNYPTDIFDLIRRRVKVHIANIESLSALTVHLSTGESLRNIDLLCCATGWRHELNMTFLDGNKDLRQSLGLPHHSSTIDPATTEADAAIFKELKTLRYQPRISKNPASETCLEGKAVAEEIIKRPYNLFRFMLPPAYLHKRNIAFAGITLSTSAGLIAQTQALWLTAYLGGQLRWLPSSVQKSTSSRSTQDDIEWQAVLENRFIRWRYRDGIDGRFPHLFFETLSYIDMLLGDLGLRRWRKKSRFAEILMPYMTPDHRGLIGEWQQGTVEGVK
ncbi:MAG: hypothetical protein Q9160_006121 [Pyrenula sp. 1 TL-2023]